MSDATPDELRAMASSVSDGASSPGDVLRELKRKIDFRIGAHSEGDIAVNVLTLRQWADTLATLLAGRTGWQPIATAPKDGTRLLLWDGILQFTGWCAEHIGSGERFWTDGHLGRAYPTHWMPLPDPPSADPRTAPEKKEDDTRVDCRS